LGSSGILGPMHSVVNQVFIADKAMKY
jgi:hypothetical protein